MQTNEYEVVPAYKRRKRGGPKVQMIQVTPVSTEEIKRDGGAIVAGVVLAGGSLIMAVTFWRVAVGIGAALGVVYLVKQYRKDRKGNGGRETIVVNEAGKSKVIYL